MSQSPELERLAADWNASGSATAFAALAEGLRKAGALDEAWSVVLDGVTRYPAFVPGRVVQAAVLRARGAPAAAEAALREALAVDPDNPVAREALGLSGGEVGDHVGALSVAPSESELFADPADHAFPGEEVLSESLAVLYHRQGHLEQAATAYAALAARHPEESRFAERHSEVAAELAARRPLPFAATQSGGRSVAAWLASVAAAPGSPRAPREGFDAFYQAPPTPPEATADFEAFQRWLEGLGR